VVADLAAWAEMLFATIAATWRRTRSAASAPSRSWCSSAQRYSIAMFWPSTNPASLRPWRKAATKCAEPAAAVLRRNPITGIAGCCARAAKGQAAALPSSAMKSRRLTGSPQSQPSRTDYSRSGPCIAARSGNLCPRWVISAVSAMSATGPVSRLFRTRRGTDPPLFNPAHVPKLPNEWSLAQCVVGFRSVAGLGRIQAIPRCHKVKARRVEMTVHTIHS
jgi:hypothetical protein